MHDFQFEKKLVLDYLKELDKAVPESVADIINKNWSVVEEFSSSEDKTMRVLGMKFPREGYN